MIIMVLEGALKSAEVGGAVHWQAATITGEEAVNELYWFEITMSSLSSDIEGSKADGGTSIVAQHVEADLTGSAVAFYLLQNVDASGNPPKSMSTNVDPEIRYGIVTSVRVLGETPTTAGNRLTVHITVRPRLWLLTHRRNTKIWQNLYTHEIVTRVLGASGITHRWTLNKTQGNQGKYHKRLSCTQYKETDYEFVTRILAEDGMFFFFDHDADFSYISGGGADATDSWTNARNTVGMVGSVAKGVGGLASSIAGAAGNKSLGNTLGGIGDTVSNVTGIISDLLTPNADPDWDFPISGPLTGVGGPPPPTIGSITAPTSGGYSAAQIQQNIANQNQSPLFGATPGQAGQIYDIGSDTVYNSDGTTKASMLVNGQDESKYYGKATVLASGEVFVFADWPGGYGGPYVPPGASGGDASSHNDDNEAGSMYGVSLSSIKLKDGASEFGSMSTALALIYNPTSGALTDATSNIVSVIHPQRTIASALVTLQQYNYRRPLQLLNATYPPPPYKDPTGNAAFGAQFGKAPGKSNVTFVTTKTSEGGYGLASGSLQSLASAAVGAASMEIYNHEMEYETPEVDNVEAAKNLDAYRANAELLEGRSVCPAMKPGYPVKLTPANGVSMEGLDDFGDTYGKGGSADTSLFGTGVRIPVRVIHEAHDPALLAGPVTVTGTHGHGTVTVPSDPVLYAAASAMVEVQRAGRLFSEAELRDMLRVAMSEGPATNGNIPVYRNRFVWVDSQIAYRPKRPERVHNAVTETALVVGPPGKDINTDKYGRVQVQFHWDRDGAYTGKPSAAGAGGSFWVRVVQPWAGAGFGFQFIPRVGMEVIVTFLGGDPDRPVVTGCVYNATHPTPELLPQRATRSGIRTQSSPSKTTIGFNEISFDDAAGTERIYFHAQKDLHEVINDSHITQVKGKETTTVLGQQVVSVGDQSLSALAQDRVQLVGGNQTYDVAGDLVERVGKSRTELVQQNSVVDIRGLSVTEVARDALTVVRGDQNIAIHGNSVTHVGGKGGAADTAKATALTFVQGSSFHTATDHVLIRAEKWDKGDDGFKADSSTVRLEVGNSFIQLSQDKIVLSAKNIEVWSLDRKAADGKLSSLKMSPTEIDLDSPADGGKIEITSKAAIDLKTKAYTNTCTDSITLFAKSTKQVIDNSGFTVSGGAITLTAGKGASLTLTDSFLGKGMSNATLKAPQIALAMGAGAPAAAVQTPDQPQKNTVSGDAKTSKLNITLQLPDGKPFASIPYRLEVTRPDTDNTGNDAQKNILLTDNFVFEGTTSDKGELKSGGLEIKGKAKKDNVADADTTDYSKSKHATLILFANDKASKWNKLYPSPLYYDIHLDDTYFTTDTSKDNYEVTRQKLQNLGYQVGGPPDKDGDTKATSMTTAALRYFQRDYDLDVDGSLTTKAGDAKNATVGGVMDAVGSTATAAVDGAEQGGALGSSIPGLPGWLATGLAAAGGLGEGAAAAAGAFSKLSSAATASKDATYQALKIQSQGK